jgi:hypothetical protein
MGDGLKRAFQATANSREVAKRPTLKHNIYLVQRVKSKFIQRASKHLLPDPIPTSIDYFFTMDYMGSAEFEYGALPAALKRMRAATMVSEPKRIKVAGKYLCWYVGPEDEYTLAKMLFIDQLGLSGDFTRLKERTCIRDNFVDERGPSDVKGISVSSRFAKTRDDYDWYDAWWAIEKTFAIFKKKEDAETWLRCVKNTP